VKRCSSYSIRFLFIFTILAIGTHLNSAMGHSSNLAQLVKPWSGDGPILANSEQRNSLFFGISPYEFYTLDMAAKDPGPVVLPLVLKPLLQNDLVKLAAKLSDREVWFEVYPARSDDVLPKMVVARYRFKQGSWQWNLRSDQEEFENLILPQRLDPRQEEQRLFGDILSMGLYDKPVAQDCVFVSRLDGKVKLAWPQNAVGDIKRLSDSTAWDCIYLPLPPLLNMQAQTFYIKMSQGHILWPVNLEFRDEVKSQQEDTAFSSSEFFPNFSSLYKESYRHQLKVISGETKAPGFARFKRKNNVQSDNQLLSMAAYFSSYYHKLGLKTSWQKFKWHNINHANLVATKVPDAKSDDGVIIVADHYDTAFSENIFERSGERVSNPGADDNASASAGLLVLAHALRTKKTRQPLWFVHLTGEEFPADDLGARKLVEMLLRQKIKIKAIIVMDMIAYRKPSWAQHFQISYGQNISSAELANIVFRNTSFPLLPLKRSRFDARTFIHQTDALVFSDYGFPVVLVNEWLNSNDHWDRPHYHQSSDRVDTLDLDYALKILETVANTICDLTCMGEN